MIFVLYLHELYVHVNIWSPICHVMCLSVCLWQCVVPASGRVLTDNVWPAGFSCVMESTTAPTDLMSPTRMRDVQVTVTVQQLKCSSAGDYAGPFLTGLIKCCIRPYVRPSTKFFPISDEIWYASRGRWVIQDGMPRSRSRSRRSEMCEIGRFQSLSPPPVCI